MRVIAVSKEDCSEADCHTLVVRDSSTGYAVVLIRQRGELIEVLTPENADFDLARRVVEQAISVRLPGPTGVKPV